MNGNSRRARAAWKAIGVGVAALLLGPATATAQDADAVLRNAFDPYAEGPPHYPGYEPGVRIDATNLPDFVEALPEGLARVIGDGSYALETKPTFSVEISPNYIQATREQLGKVKLGEKTGDISGFTAGRPFPEEPARDD